jgi:outer membrane protein assembly factor BamB
MAVALAAGLTSCSWTSNVQPGARPCRTLAVRGSVVCAADPTHSAVRHGMAGVIVSDGLQVTRTDDAGRYVLRNVDPADRHFVYVVTPSGYRVCGSFYQALPTSGDTADISFTLAPAPETANPDFSFVQITDTHVASARDAHRCLDLLHELTRYHPVFAINTGDLVDNGNDPRQFDKYAGILRDTPLPVVNVPGNHDLNGPKNSYDRVCGPERYAFDYGGRHFLVLNSITDVERQYKWMEQELALQPPGKELLVFQHYPPEPRLMKLLTRYHTRAIFTGHWHGSRVFTSSGIVYVNTPPLRFGGIDQSPCGSRMVTFKHGQILLDDVYPELGPRDAWASRLARPRPAADAATPLPGADWPMFAHDPARGSRTDDLLKPPLKLAWRAELGGTIEFSSPVVAGGYVYVGLADEQQRGTAGVYALNAVTGASHWFYRTDASIKHSVTVSGGLVYAATAEGEVVAIDAAGGERKWKYDFDRPMDTWLFASPLVSREVVYTGTADRFVALEAATGKLVWSDDHPAGVWLACHSSPTAGDGLIYADFNDQSGLFAFDARTGKLRWRQPTYSSLHATPAFSGGILYTVARDRVLAVSPEDGSTRWKSPSIGGNCASTPTVVDGKVLVGTSDGTLVALSAADGSQCWRCGGSPGSPRSPLSFSPYQGVSSPMIATPAISGGVAYVGTAGGRLLAVDVKTGRELWHCDLGSPIVSSAAISGNAVYVATYDGTVYAFTSTSK